MPQGGQGLPQPIRQRQVVANDWAFAARRDDGSVVCWGDSASGGDVTPVAEKIAAGGVEDVWVSMRKLMAVNDSL